MKLALIFTVMVLVLFKVNDASSIWPLQQCDRREIHNSCPTNCPEVCRYGRHKNANCLTVRVCVPRCVCRAQYILDPLTNECWTRSYCLYKRKMSFFKGIFGIKE